ncbi:MAG: ectonucleotide pyrophosphatase/phosphodiesterase, partial [Terracidiphilus sp.]
GMHAAVLLWPGSEAEIAGFRPTWYARWDAETANSPAALQARIDNVVTLLRLPPADRPHFVAIYYPEPDHEGHESGPDSSATRKAVLKMDAEIGKLKSVLDSTGLPIDLVVVSDHGMARTEGGWINLDSFTNLMGFETAGSLLYTTDEQDRVRVYNQLKKASSEFTVYRLKDVPPELNYNQNQREGDPVVVATGPFAIRATAPEGGIDRAPPLGMHGFDPAKVPEMKASFFAAGPDILPGKTVAPFENVNLYPWIAHMLGLEPAKNDGSLNILAGTLRDNGGEQEKTEQDK